MKTSITYITSLEILSAEAGKIMCEIPSDLIGAWIVGGMFSSMPSVYANGITEDQENFCREAKEKIKFISRAFSRQPIRDQRPVGVDGSGNLAVVWEMWDEALARRLYHQATGEHAEAANRSTMDAVKATEAAEQLGVCPVDSHAGGMAELAAAGKPEFMAISAVLLRKAQINPWPKS